MTATLNREAFEHVALVNRTVVPVEAPERILVVPWGNVASASGDFTIDANAAQSIVEYFEAGGVDMLIDYEHHSMRGKHSAPDGTAKAAGWINKLEIEDGVGIWAHVEWTEAASALVQSKEYRYLSPVTLSLKATGEVKALASVALTNTPAIVGMRPIVNNMGGSLMSEEKMERARWFLKLPETATADQIVSELEVFAGQIREAVGATEEQANSKGILGLVKQLGGRRAALVAKVCSAAGLELKSDADDETIATALSAAVQSDTDTDTKAHSVLLKRLEASENKVAELEANAQQRAADERIQAAINSGQLTQADLESKEDGAFYRELAGDGDKWNRFMKRLPAKAPAKGAAHSARGGTATADGGDRMTVIANARREYDDAPELHKLTSREAYVQDGLRSAGHSTTLSDDEKRAAGI